MTAIRGGLVEAVFCAALLVQVALFGFSVGPAWATWVEIFVCLAGALSGKWPRETSIFVGLALVALVAAPTESGRFSMLVVFIVIASLGARAHLLWSALSGFCYLLLIAIIESGNSVTFSGVVRWTGAWVAFVIAAWCVGFIVWRAREQRRNLIAERDASIRAHRIELARDLHDALAGAVTIMMMRAQQALLRPNTDVEVQEDLGIIISAGNDAMRDVRTLMGALRQDGQGQQEAVAQAAVPLGNLMAGKVRELESQGFRPRVLLEGDLQSLPLSALRTATKVLDEAVANVLKHGKPGTSCELMLACDGEQLEVLVTNVRSGVHKRQLNHVGLLGLQERVEAQGGELVASQDALRHFLQVRLPIGAE